MEKVLGQKVEERSARNNARVFARISAMVLPIISKDTDDFPQLHAHFATFNFCTVLIEMILATQLPRNSSRESQRQLSRRPPPRRCLHQDLAGNLYFLRMINASRISPCAQM
jgi:hypothetical protein